MFSYTHPVRSVLLLNFKDENMEAQRGKAACPKSCHLKKQNMGSNWHVFHSQACAFCLQKWTPRRRSGKEYVFIENLFIKKYPQYYLYKVNIKPFFPPPPAMNK